MFDPKDSISPVDKSSKTYTFTPKDKIRLKEIRKFSKNYFENNDLESTSLEEVAKKKLKEFDSICYVLDTKPKKLKSRVLLCDQSKVFKLYLSSSRKIFFPPFTVVRLRAATYVKNKAKECLEFNDYSNIMPLLNEYKSASELISVIKSKKVSEEVLEKIDYYLRDPNIIVPISHPVNKKSKVVHLKEIYSGDSSKSKGKVFHINANVIEIGPRNPSDWICAIDTPKTPKPQKPLIYIY